MFCKTHKETLWNSWLRAQILDQNCIQLVLLSRTHYLHYLILSGPELYPYLLSFMSYTDCKLPIPYHLERARLCVHAQGTDHGDHMIIV